MSAVGKLSFTRTRPRTEWEANGLLPRCFWHVQPTGNYAEDNQIGFKLALEYLECQASNPHLPSLLGNIVSDFPAEHSGIEVGFLDIVGIAAASGLPRARQIVAHYQRAGASR